MTRERFKVVPAVYLVLRRDDQVLLSQRLNTGHMDGYFGLPSGHHDGGETLMQAMCREAKEEIGISITPDDLTFAHVMHRQADDGERVDFYFTCDVGDREVKNCEEEKCSELRWTSIDNLPENTIPVVRQALLAISKAEDYSETME